MKEIDDINRNDEDGECTRNWHPSLKQTPFSTPDDYFENLERVTRFRATRTTLDRENFPVPGGYFEKLEQRILARTVQGDENRSVEGGVPVVPIGSRDLLEDVESVEDPKVRRLGKRSWVKYATAACLVLMTSLLITNRLRTESDGFSLSSIPDQELINYLQTFSSTQDILLISEYVEDFGSLNLHSDISSDEIESYLANSL